MAAATLPFPHAGYVAALASSLLWATGVIVFRRMKGRAPASAMNLAKNVTGATCFALLLLVWTGGVAPSALTGEATAWLALSGIVGFTICDTYFLRAVLELGPRRATLVMTLAPVLVFAATLHPAFGQRAELARPWPWAGLLLALVGVWLAATEERDPLRDARRERRGVVDAVVAAVFQSAAVLSARLGFQSVGDVGDAGDSTGLLVPAEGTYVRLLAGTVGLLVVGSVTGLARPWVQALRRPSTLLPLALAAVFGTFLGVGFNQCGIRWADSTGAATTINALSPVWLVPLSAWFLGERHTLRAWLSTLVAIAGVALLAM